MGAQINPYRPNHAFNALPFGQQFANSSVK